jgi:hypothetical protein
VVMHQKQVRYALGKFWTVLCGDELGRALSEGLIENVGRMSVYNIAPIFRDFVKYWYGQRERARVGKIPHLDRLAKMMLNSLYGKFAQRSPKWLDTPDICPDIDYGEFWHYGVNDAKPKVYRSFAGNVQQRIESVDGNNSFCAVSSFVTANAREYMRSIREKNGIIGPAMGQLREIEEASRIAEFFGPGDYEFGRSVVQSGRKSSAKVICPGTIQQDNFNGLAYVIARGNQGGVVGTSCTVHRHPGKGKLNRLDNGFAKPFILNCPLPERQEPLELQPLQMQFGRPSQFGF